MQVDRLQRSLVPLSVTSGLRDIVVRDMSGMNRLDPRAGVEFVSAGRLYANDTNADSANGCNLFKANAPSLCANELCVPLYGRTPGLSSGIPRARQAKNNSSSSNSFEAKA